MFKKAFSIIALCLAISSAAVFAAKPKTKAYSADDENYTWYEFDANALGHKYHFYAFKTDEQRDNRVQQILNKNGWGMNPKETITEYFNFESGEKTILFDEELKPEMKEKGYKYACTIYKRTTKSETTIYLLSFLYDKETDVLTVQKSYK